MSLSRRDRRALVAGTAAVALIGGGRPVVSSGARWSASTREEVAMLTTQVANEAASIRGASVARDSLVARRIRLAALDTALFEAATPGLAAAMLAEQLADAAQSSKAQMSNLQLRSDSSRAKIFVPVAVQASVTGDWSAIGRFLTQLETGRKLVALRELTLSSLPSSSAPGQRPSVRADILVDGLAKIEPMRATGP